MEITTRNAATVAFTQARHLVQNAQSVDAFLGPGTYLEDEYEGALYQTHIASDGETVIIRSAAEMTNGVDTVDFAVSAEVEWASYPVAESGASRYLVLKTYREE